MNITVKLLAITLDNTALIEIYQGGKRLVIGGATNTELRPGAVVVVTVNDEHKLQPQQ